MKKKGCCSPRVDPEQISAVMSHLSDLFEGFKIYIRKDVALWKWQDLEGHSTVVILQRWYVVVAHRQLRAGIDLVPDRRTARHGSDYLHFCVLTRDVLTFSPHLTLSKNRPVFIPELNPSRATFTVHWQFFTVAKRKVKTHWGHLASTLACLLTPLQAEPGDLTCCCSQGGPGRDTRRLSSESPCLWVSASPWKGDNWHFKDKLETKIGSARTNPTSSHGIQQPSHQVTWHVCVTWRLQRWIMPYIIWLTQKQWRKLWKGLLR